MSCVLFMGPPVQAGWAHWANCSVRSRTPRMRRLASLREGEPVLANEPGERLAVGGLDAPPVPLGPLREDRRARMQLRDQRAVDARRGANVGLPVRHGTNSLPFGGQCRCR